MANDNKLKMVAKAIEIAYILFASCILCHVVYRTIEKMNEGNVLVKEEVRVLPKVKYPSVTFCYKYKHGTKFAIHTYNSHLAKNWLKSACLMEDISIVHDTSSPHANLKSYLDCKEECAKQKDCLLWTHIGGRCYLKTDNTFTATNSKVTSGKKGCNSSGCALPKTDYFGGDLRRERAETLQECQNRCIEVSECKRWTFLNMDMTGRCYMKNTTNGLMTSTLPALTGSRDSGVKKCGNNDTLHGGQRIFEDMAFDRNDFLSTFDQMFTMNESAVDMLRKDGRWTLSFPFEESGPCYTYDPPFASDPGLPIGIFVTMKSDRWDPDLRIFLHEENKFFYTEGLDSEVTFKFKKLEEEGMMHPKAMVSIEMEKKLSTSKKPCNEDSSYSFFRCVEKYFYKQRGCQFPWNVYKDLDLPVCSNYTVVSNILGDGDRNKGKWRDHFTHFERTVRTKMECWPPCSVTEYKTKLEKWQDWRPGRSLQIVLTDFAITYKEEYLGCDLPCIIGEIGGNLGFYLGASILLIIQLCVGYLSRAVESVCRFYGRRW